MDYYILDGGFSSGEEEDVETARKYYDLERKRIRAFIKALCNDTVENLSRSCEQKLSIVCQNLFVMVPIMSEPLLSERRDGYYTVYPMYKSHRGRELLFPNT